MTNKLIVYRILLFLTSVISLLHSRSMSPFSILKALKTVPFLNGVVGFAEYGIDS